jgi:4-diphosphocytidyl-2-C-methyl-D-erythritol kinase
LKRRGAIREALEYWRRALEGEDEGEELDRTLGGAQDPRGAGRSGRGAEQAAAAVGARWPRRPGCRELRLRAASLAAFPLAAAALAAAGCASASLPPPADVAQRAGTARSYSGRLRVSLRGPEMRGRTAALLGFRRPDGLRIEIPGPTGARLVAVAHGEALTAVFPAERAVFRGEATAAGLEDLLGVALSPSEVMDLLVGTPSPRVRDYRVRWGPSVPRELQATLPDGGRLKVTVESATRGSRPARRGLRGAGVRGLPRGRSRRGAAAVGRAMSGRVVRVPSFAKINLGLEVLGTRQDGYHELRTIFQTIDLRDDVELRGGGRDITVVCGHPAVPDGPLNLAARAAFELRRYAKTSDGVEIRITKRIPVAGGMGGGSSNAAAVLMGLDRMWRLGLGPAGPPPAGPPHRGGRALLPRGGHRAGPRPRGRGLSALPPGARPRGGGRPGPAALDRRRVPAPRQKFDTPGKQQYNFSLCIEGLGGRGCRPPALANDLETAALEEAPALGDQVRRIRGILVREGAVSASLSGSGSSFFGLFDDHKLARRAQAALVAHGFAAFRGRTLSLGQYRGAWRRALGHEGREPAKERTSWR